MCIAAPEGRPAPNLVWTIRKTFIQSLGSLTCVNAPFRRIISSGVSYCKQLTGSGGTLLFCEGKFRCKERLALGLCRSRGAGINTIKRDKRLRRDSTWSTVVEDDRELVSDQREIICHCVPTQAATRLVYFPEGSIWTPRYCFWSRL